MGPRKQMKREWDSTHCRQAWTNSNNGKPGAAETKELDFLYFHFHLGKPCFLFWPIGLALGDQVTRLATSPYHFKYPCCYCSGHWFIIRTWYWTDNMIVWQFFFLVVPWESAEHFSPRRLLEKPVKWLTGRLWPEMQLIRIVYVSDFFCKGILVFQKNISRPENHQLHHSIVCAAVYHFVLTWWCALMHHASCSGVVSSACVVWALSYGTQKLICVCAG